MGEECTSTERELEEERSLEDADDWVTDGDMVVDGTGVGEVVSDVAEAGVEKVGVGGCSLLGEADIEGDVGG